MNKNILIKNATLINEGETFNADIYVKNGRIEQIESCIDNIQENFDEFDAFGKYVFPGVIDDQVHFREPGLTHKGTIASESKAAVAGGITSFMEMPNTQPPALTRTLLEDKYAIASRNAYANYSFYIGASDDNLNEILQTDFNRVCGIKIFLGSSTGNLKVKDPKNVEALFREAPAIIAAHCEDDDIIDKNKEKILSEYGEDLPPYFHAIIRNHESCFSSSKYAVELAESVGARFHVLHISTAQELKLFEKNKHIPLKQKRITAEACIHHLWFYDEDYNRLGNFIKWNPSVKTLHDREAIRAALLDGTIDVVATDHAPHTLDEKKLPLLKAPSGGPLVQHSLLAMIDLHNQGVFPLEKIPELMSHRVAELFGITDRGYLREGYFADLVVVDMDSSHEVTKNNLLYHCGWSPFEGHMFSSTVVATMINGNWAYKDGIFQQGLGMRLEFHGNKR
ncbi:MAG: dihydroorotase [Bacteroidia bacterium]|nr:dihydroorotase [Bacteroidia bacterium]